VNRDSLELRVIAHRGERRLQVLGRYLDAQHPCIVGTAVDITARSAALAALSRSEARLHAVLDAAIDGIVTIDEDDRLESVNRTAATILRSTPEALVGSRWQDHLVARGGVLPTRQVVHELVGRRGDGTSFPVECGFTEIPSAQPLVTIAIFRDISERRLLEQQVHDVSEQLLRQIGQDLHDGLGQLLTGTAFLAKGLQEQVNEETRPQAQRVVELVNQAIGRVRSLARGLSPIHLEAHSLEAVMHHVVGESSKLLGVDCVLELRDPVETDRLLTMAQLCLITREAITNAVRHGQARRIVVSLARRDGSSVLSIEDDGSGFSGTHQHPTLVEARVYGEIVERDLAAAGASACN